jgi:aspartyl-tRNA(Asn)/glutamyl-tRNA(Gln) amidotransferase subunit C
MNINEETIYKVANLARIEIKEQEVPGLIDEMSKILTFMEQLNALDTVGVEPLVYMNETQNVWREDIAKGELPLQDAIKNAAEHNERFFMVPKIIEK